MKIIIIKDCKEGNINDIVDVSDGYAKNFLIKKGFGISLNHATLSKRDTNIENLKKIEQSKIDDAKKLKIILEELILEFELKVTNEVIHGSISRKKITHELRKRKIKIETNHIENIQIKSIGISKLKVNIYKDVIAVLRIKVKSV